MDYSPDNLVYCLAVTESAYAAFRDEHGGKGFRTISLSLSGTAASPRYTGVMARYPTPFRGQSVLRCNRDGLHDEISLKRQTGLHPYIISATGPSGSAVYAAAFREMASQPVVKSLLNTAEYEAENKAQLQAGRILLWVDSFGAANSLRYCAIWVANTARLAWNADAVNDLGATRQQRFDAMVASLARPACVAMTPAGGVARLYVDDRIGSWDAKSAQLRAELDGERATQAAKGQYPVCIGAAVVGGSTRFATIFAKRDDALPRVLRVRGPQPVGLTAANLGRAADLDACVEKFMRNYHLRGAALAIVEGTRLVYAKGYTLAEQAPHYPDIEPTTAFRLASVSKTLAAVAVWKGLADSPTLSRASTMQSLLKLKAPGSVVPPDPDFARITLRHLLESNSGIDQIAVRATIAAAKDSSDVQPLTTSKVASRVAALHLLGQPGAAGATQYGRTDYVLLGLVAAKLAGTAGFHQALKKLVLDPLHMTRTRGSTSKIEHQFADEAHYHTACDVRTGKSAVHNDRRIVPTPYGDDNMEVFSSAGGVSSAIVDLARLCAMFSCRLANPLFSVSTLDAFLADAVNAAHLGNDKGYHGFDTAHVDNAARHRVYLSKGGSLPGARAGFEGTTGERFVVVAYNGEPWEDTGVKVDIKADAKAVADSVDWGKGDLFPHFGMPSLGLSAAPGLKLKATKR